MADLPIGFRSLMDEETPASLPCVKTETPALLSPPVPCPNNVCLPRFLGWCSTSYSVIFGPVSLPSLL